MPRTLQLGLLAGLFIFSSQLFARLIGYTQTFHTGLLLVNASLLGGGILTLLYHCGRGRWKEYLDQHLIHLLPCLLTASLIFFSRFQSFAAILVCQFFISGVFFLAIARFIEMSADRFYFSEMLGSLAGALIFFGASTQLLEEQILIGLGLVLMAWSLANFLRDRTLFSPLWWSWGLNGLMIFACWALPLPLLIECNSTDYFSKSVCLAKQGNLPIASFPQHRGRSDLYHAQEGMQNELRLRNNGFYVGSSFHRDQLAASNVVWSEPRVPSLPLPTQAQIFELGPSIGGRIQALQKYLDRPVITAVEVDHSLSDLYQTQRFDEFLPSRESFRFFFEEGRRFLSRNADQYDLIDVSVEEINSPAKDRFIDESTSLLFTVEALQLYQSRLKENGFLLLETYYPQQEFGDAMAVKFLQGLFQSQFRELSDFSKQVVIYSWAFSAHPLAQRLMAVVFKKTPYSTAEVEAISRWMTDFNREAQAHHVRRRVTPLHLPGTSTIYQAFFDASRLKSLESRFPLRVNTDNQPFRHQITTLPLKAQHYIWFLVLSLVFLGVFAWHRRQNPGGAAASFIWQSSLSGLATFGLQYLLFYRSAAFLSTSLMQFSNFLILAFAFSSFGAKFLLQKSSWRALWIAGFAILITALVFISPAETPVAILLVLVAGLFFFSGTLFPSILAASHHPADRVRIYAVNLFCGGLSSGLLITAHSVWGWQICMAMVFVLMITLFWFAGRKFQASV